MASPKAISAATATFADEEAACNATIMAIQYGLPVSRIELLDALNVKAVNAYSDLGLPEQPLLLLEFIGTEAAVAEQTAVFHRDRSRVRRHRSGHSRP